MRITFLIPLTNPSGGIRVVATYAERLQQRGHRVIVVETSSRRVSLRRRLGRLWRRDRRPPWGWTPPRGPHFAGSTVEVRELSHHGPIRSADVPDGDVVIATWWATAPVVLGLPPSKGRKFYFIQGHESHLPTVPTDRADATWRFPLKKIVVSEWLATLARETFGDQTAICVPNGVDTKLFFAPIRTKQALPTIGFIYAPGKERGVDIAIAALAEAKRHVPELRVSSFGLTTPGGDLPLPSWVDFTLQPAQSMLRTLYASCDAFLRPNRIDGFGLPTLEAMACRTPVIATRAGAAPELLRRGGGHLLDSHSPEDMAAAISSVVRATELRWREWSDAAHATAMAYSWDEATKAFEAALHGG